MTTRAEVLQEFTRWSGWPDQTLTLHTTHWYDTDALADEVVRLRERLRIQNAVDEIHRLLDEAYAHYFTHGDGCHKRDEGAVWVEWPNHFERAGGNTEPRVGIYSYVFADAREDRFDTVDEALEAVQEWHREELARTYTEGA